MIGRMNYRKEIDGLRAVAVLPVIFFHAGFEFFSGGYVGVDVFFVISGYLITTIILSEMQAGQFSIANFYERRARRILPALFFVVLLCLPFAWRWMMPNDLKEFSESVIAVSFFYSNVFFWLQSGYFDTAAELKPLLHTWSLAVEEQYYLLFPLFILFMWRFGKRAIFYSLVLTGTASLALAQWNAIDSPAATFFLLPFRLWELLVGSLTAFYLLYGARGRLDPQAAPEYLRQLAGISGLLMILYSIVAFDEHTPFPGFFALVPTLGTALIIVFAGNDSIIGRFLGNRVFVGIGLISYSAYLWHQPLFAFGRLNTLGEPRSELMVALGALALALAYLTWRYVEQPFRNKQRFSRQIVFRGAVVLTVAFGLTGFTGQYRDGELERYTASQLQRAAEIEQLKQERRSLMRADECHFTEQHQQGLEHFLDNWNCWDQDGGLRQIPVVVVGDSHAADLVVALRTNGYQPLQIGGSGCSLNPDFMTSTCTRIFAKLFEKFRASPTFEHVVLANRFSRNELSIESIQSTIDYWQQLGPKVAIVSGMPTFRNFEKAITLERSSVPDFEMAEYSQRSEIVDYLTERGVHYINKKQLFCSITSTCDYRDTDRTLLMVDQDHLSREGARRFGEQLLKHDALFRSIVAQTKQPPEVIPTR